MAFPFQRGLTPPEIEFLSEMDMVTVVPRQRLEELDLLSVRERIGPRNLPHPRGLGG
jgi:hypothetical protein